MKPLGLSLDQWINIILTALIVIAVCAQAVFTYRQARLLEEAGQRKQDRDKPSIRIVSLTHVVDRLEPSGGLETASFYGFTVTNAGFVDVVIASFAFETGRAASSGEDDAPTAEIVFPPVTRHDQSAVSTMSLPHRLRHGESFSVLFDRMQLVEESTRIGGEIPVHMRPYCSDSLGNKHKFDGWIVYQKGNSTSYVTGPSPGRISEEEWGRLKPAERRRYSRWSRRVVGG